jgi:hypothetical protein
MGPSIKYVSTFFWGTGSKIREKNDNGNVYESAVVGDGLVSKISKKILYGRPL